MVKSFPNILGSMGGGGEWNVYVYVNNGFIISWTLQQIIMYSNKLKHVAGKNNDPPIHLLYPIPSTLLDDQTE